MPLQATSGAASYDAFGGGVAAVPNYIEDVFSTYLYTGNGSTQTITNGIDLSGEGGLVWLKNRSVTSSHRLVDTVRGALSTLFSESTSAAVSRTAPNTDVNSFTSTGFVAGNFGSTNGNNWASWTFRKQPKFFDVVTYTGNSTTGRQIAHNLGSTPGCIIVKNITTSGTQWPVYHRGIADSYLHLDTTDANSAASAKYIWGNDVSFIAPTSTVFTVGGTNAGYEINRTGETYVAYLFAHNAGGFGLTGTDNVISCGSMTTSTPLVNVNLGYEPQWVMWKRTDAVGNWGIADNMRGMPVSGDDQVLIPNLSNAESLATRVAPNATGFTFDGGVADGSTFIYIAIRRGPMKVPTSGTSVYATDTLGGTSPNPPGFNSGFPVDLGFYRETTSAFDWNVNDRLRGNVRLFFNSTAAESSTTTGFDYQDGFNSSTSVLSSYRAWMFGRAPSFFDEVCYTGTGSATTVAHNLGVAPELMIVKARSATASWRVYSAPTTANKFMVLNAEDRAATDSSMWNGTAPTASVFSLGNALPTNWSGQTFVAYLFASAPGVSKVGSYTGTGATLQINCGFTTGARFVLIKRTDDPGGDWYVWDSARGVVAGNDPYLLLNSTAAEETSTDYVDTYSAGFEISSTAPAAINASGGTYIFLAIA